MFAPALVTAIVAFSLVVGTTAVHFEALRRTSRLLPHCGFMGRARVFIVVVVAFSAHIVEILLYGATYYLLQHEISTGSLAGRHEATFADYLYFSTVIYTSLGLGDVYPTGQLRLISGIETLNGLLLIGWSTSFTFLAMRSYWPLEHAADD